MKNLILFIVLTLFCFPTLGQKGVNFETLTFEEALAKAQEQKKMLFIDCYTSWCGPCKYMTETVFPREDIGNYLNEKFVCVKYDMEKGEGPELSKRFGIRAFPTFVLLTPDGTLRHKMVGSSKPEEFIPKVKEGLDDAKALGTLEIRYKNGDRDKEMLSRYVQILSKTYDRVAPAVAEELFKTLNDEEKISPEYWFIYDRNDLSPRGSTAIQYLISHRKAFSQAFGTEKIDERLSKGYAGKLTNIFLGREKKLDTKTLNKMSREVKNLKLNDGKMIQSYISIAKSLNTNDIEKILKTCEKEFLKIPKGKAPFYIFQPYTSKATDAQNKRWDKLMVQITQ